MFIAKRVPNFIYVCVLFVRLNFVVSYFNINTRQLTENLLFFLVQMSKSVYKVSSEREFIVDVFQLSAVFFSLFFLYMLLSMLFHLEIQVPCFRFTILFLYKMRERKKTETKAAKLITCYFLCLLCIPLSYIFFSFIYWNLFGGAFVSFNLFCIFDEPDPSILIVD